MELVHYVLSLLCGAEIVGATWKGQGARLVIVAVAAGVSLVLPEGVDPAVVLVEFLIARRLA